MTRACVCVCVCPIACSSMRISSTNSLSTYNILCRTIVHIRVERCTICGSRVASINYIADHSFSIRRFTLMILLLADRYNWNLLSSLFTSITIAITAVAMTDFGVLRLRRRRQRQQRRLLPMLLLLNIPVIHVVCLDCRWTRASCTRRNIIKYLIYLHVCVGGGVCVYSLYWLLFIRST